MKSGFSLWLKLRQFTVLLGLVGFCQVVQAIEVTQIYEANLPCQSQDPKERAQLIKQGLLQVFERLSVDQKIESSPKIQKALEKPAEYVEQYRYEDNQLIIKFSQTLLDQLIYQSGNTVWGKRRPNVVLWLAIEQNGDRHLVGQESDPNLQQQLQQMAKSRGLPLVLPIMDLEDVSQVTATDVMGQFPEVIRKASMRYEAPIILVGHVIQRQGDNNWESSWQLMMDEVPLTWQAQGQSLNEVLNNGINGTTQHLMGRFGVKSSETPLPGKPFLLGVQGIRSAADYMKVETYLQSLNEVTRVDIYQVDGEVAVFEITPKGENGREIFMQAINLDHRLSTNITPDQSLATVDLVYRWVPQGG